jgi:hypothetical protein
MNRRGAIAGIVAAGAALAAGVYRFTDLFVKHYPPTPYDDLLGQLTDRGQAARLGAKAADAPDAQGLATGLRAALQGRDLPAAANADIAAGQMVEIGGWVLPRTVAWLSMLAAKA